MVQSFQSSQGSAPAQASNDARASPGEPTGRSKISWLGESWRRELRELDSSPVGNHFLSVSAHPSSSSSSQHLSTFRTTSSGISLLRLTHLLQILVVIFLLLSIFIFISRIYIFKSLYYLYIYIKILYIYYTYIIHILYIYYTYIIQYMHNRSGWWFEPLWKILFNGKDYPIYYGK